MKIFYLKANDRYIKLHGVKLHFHSLEDAVDTRDYLNSNFVFGIIPGSIIVEESDI